uniref:A-kinase anchor protein 2 C-terminal domain-containing protein n=1 Tax=Echeneis naucrates TaxID=173247 RepID=A0A665X8M0_ECHNA
MGENQEAAQQVQGKVSLPLWTVAMELSNQGRAASRGFGCAASRVWERTDEESEQRKAVGKQHGTGILRCSKTVQFQELETKKYRRAVSFKHSKLIKMESDLCDDSQSDSGVSTDFSPCSTLEGDATATATKETPIEREIRRAIEREQSLRKSRGLPNPPTSPEYVEIPLKTTVLCQSVTTERCQGKDRQFAGKKMQHEIHEEAQREQDLVKIGKIPGFYDKGTVRQLKERRQLFEAFQKPSDSLSTVTARCKTTSWSSTSDISVPENQGVSSQKSHTRGSHAERRKSIDLLSPTESRSVATSSSLQRPGFSEGTGRQVIILENNLSVPAQTLYHVKQETQPVPTVDSGSLNLSSSRTERYREINGRKE